MKSHVGIEQHQCPICLIKFDTGTILFDRRLRDSLNHHEVTGHSPCKDCQNKLDDNFIALIESEANSSRDSSHLLDVPRTGNIAWLKESAFKEVFNIPVPPKKICFIDPEVFQQLIRMSGEEHDQDVSTNNTAC